MIPWQNETTVLPATLHCILRPCSLYTITHLCGENGADVDGANGADVDGANGADDTDDDADFPPRDPRDTDFDDFGGGGKHADARFGTWLADLFPGDEGALVTSAAELDDVPPKRLGRPNDLSVVYGWELAITLLIKKKQQKNSRVGLGTGDYTDE